MPPPREPERDGEARGVFPPVVELGDLITVVPSKETIWGRSARGVATARGSADTPSLDTLREAMLLQFVGEAGFGGSGDGDLAEDRPASPKCSKSQPCSVLSGAGK
jgi:hypothetical protein